MRAYSYSYYKTDNRFEKSRSRAFIWYIICHTLSEEKWSNILTNICIHKLSISKKRHVFNRRSCTYTYSYCQKNNRFEQSLSRALFWCITCHTFLKGKWRKSNLILVTIAHCQNFVIHLDSSKSWIYYNSTTFIPQHNSSCSWNLPSSSITVTVYGTQTRNCPSFAMTYFSVSATAAHILYKLNSQNMNFHYYFKDS